LGARTPKLIVCSFLYVHGGDYNLFGWRVAGLFLGRMCLYGTLGTVILSLYLEIYGNGGVINVYFVFESDNFNFNVVMCAFLIY